jgi:hypothetical protein
MLDGATLTNGLLGGIALLLLIVVVQIGRLAGRLARIERGLSKEKEEHEAEGSPLLEPSAKPEEATGMGMFERFLEDRPAFRELPKAEQAAAYRKWRRERGLNWQSR